jgi:hypothetical protein
MIKSFCSFKKLTSSNRHMTEKPQRNIVIDALRGLCLVLMTVDHLPDNVLYRLSNTMFGPFGLFTAATGFMFLSGLVCGSVYGSFRHARGEKAVVKRILRRVAKLYLTHIGLVCLLIITVVTGIGQHSLLPHHFPMFYEEPVKATLLSLLFLHEPNALCILPMYCLFLLDVHFVNPSSVFCWTKGEI